MNFRGLKFGFVGLNVLNNYKMLLAKIRQKKEKLSLKVIIYLWFWDMCYVLYMP